MMNAFKLEFCIRNAFELFDIEAKKNKMLKMSNPSIRVITYRNHYDHLINIMIWL